MKHKIVYILILVFMGCNTTKNIPEGSYLLDDFTIKHDTKNATSDLEDFVRQQPNPSLLIFGKVGLGIYNMAGQDTSKWLNRTIKKIGKPPVIFNNTQTAISVTQLKKQLNNQGYLDAVVDTTLKIEEKKISVTYNIMGGTPYLIRDYQYTLSDTTMARIMNRVPIKPLLNKGDMFDQDMLEQERIQVNNIMRNVGYYNFSKEYLYFKADTTLNSHQADLYLNLYPRKDSLPYTRYKINDVTVISGLNTLNSATDGRRLGNRWFFRNADTTEVKGIKIIRGRNNFLRNSAITKNNFLKKDTYYSDMALNRTYEGYGKIGAIKQTNIDLRPSAGDSTKLDATITLLPANVHWLSTALDGTYSAGDIGIAPSISYQHQNLFNGGERLNIKLKGAYEFITGSENTDLLSQNFYEYGIETSLSLPCSYFLG